MKLIRRFPMTYAHMTISVTVCQFRYPVLARFEISTRNARFEISTRNFLMFRRRILTPSSGLRPFYFKEGDSTI